MFYEIATSIYNYYIRGALYWCQENLYNIFNWFGFELIPDHITREDEEKHTQWINNDQHRLLLCNILNTQQLPDYMRLHPDQYGFQVTATGVSYDRMLEHHRLTPLDNRTSLRDDVAIILGEIYEYNREELLSYGVVEEYFGLNLCTLKPERMILQMLQEYFRITLIEYTDKQQELDKTKLLLVYIKQLLNYDSVKSSARFHTLLKFIEQKLTQIIPKIKVDHTKQVLNTLNNQTNSFISDVLIFIYNIFYYKCFDRDTEILELDCLRIQNSKLKNWLQDIQKFRIRYIDCTRLSPDVLVGELEVFTKGNLESSDCDERLLSQALTPFRDIVCSKESTPSGTESHWQNLCQLQNQLYDFIMLNKFLGFLVHEFSNIADPDDRTYSLGHLIRVIAILKARADELMSLMSFWIDNIDIIDSYCQLPEVNDNQVSRIRQIKLRAESIVDGIKAIKDNSTQCLEIITKRYTSFNATRLITCPFYQAIEIFDHRASLRSKPLRIVDSQVRLFLMSLRVNSLFDTGILDILNQFFKVEINSEGHHVLVSLNDTIDLTESPGFIYYTILLQILICIAKSDVESDLRQFIINKIKDFLVVNYISKDESSSRHLVEILISEVGHSSQVEKQNNALRKMIELHLEEVRACILDFIEHNSCFIGDVSLPETPERHYSSDTADSRIIIMLYKFIHGLTTEVSKQQQLYVSLHSRFALSINPDKRVTASKQRTLQQEAHTALLNAQRLNLVLLHATNLLTKLVSSYVALHNNNYLISEPRSCSDAEPSIIIAGSVQTEGRLVEDQSDSRLFTRQDFQTLAQMKSSLTLLIGRSERCLQVMQHVYAKASRAYSGILKQQESSAKPPEEVGVFSLYASQQTRQPESSVGTFEQEYCSKLCVAVVSAG